MNQAKFYQAGKQERLDVFETIETVLRREGDIVFAFLHGSFLTEPTFRDIDVGVFVSTKDSSAYLDYELDLSQRIEDALPSAFPAQVKILNEAPLSFRFNVIRGKLLFTRDEDFLVDFMTSTARKYLDIAPLLQLYMKEAMAS